MRQNAGEGLDTAITMEISTGMAGTNGGWARFQGACWPPGVINGASEGGVLLICGERASDSLDMHLEVWVGC